MSQFGSDIDQRHELCEYRSELKLSVEYQKLGLSCVAAFSTFLKKKVFEQSVS